MKTYLRHKTMNVIDIKELIALEYLDFEGKYKEYVEKHDFWELCYVEKGEITLCTDGEEKPLSKGQLAIVSPDTTHSYFSSNGNKNKAFVICFESSSQSLKSIGESTFSLMEEHLACVKKIISEYKQTFRINEEDMMELLPMPGFGGQQTIILLTEYLIICLLRMRSLEKNPDVVILHEDKFYEGIVNVIVEFFRENLHRKITLEEVCKKVNYSSSFICRAFKEQTGETLVSYFTRLKVEKAKNLLEKTDMSIVSVAGELGFSEAKYFTAIFRKYAGMTPTEYKKSKSDKGGEK